MSGTSWLAGCALLALLTGCSISPGDDSYDFDGDGSTDSEDCAPEDPERYPGAPDPPEDGIDQDCDGCDGDCDGPSTERFAGDYAGTVELTRDGGGGEVDCEGTAELVLADDGALSGSGECGAVGGAAATFVFSGASTAQGAISGTATASTAGGTTEHALEGSVSDVGQIVITFEGSLDFGPGPVPALDFVAQVLATLPSRRGRLAGL